jgi:dienelactone hydrolase
MTRFRTFGLAVFLWISSSLDPLHAQSAGGVQITNLQAVPGAWLLEWQSSVSDSAYTVQFQDTLQDGIWRSPESLVPFPVSSNAWYDTSLTNDARYFRVLAAPAAERGKLLSTTLSTNYSAFFLSLVFSIAGVPITPQYGVTLYKIDYETITPWGARTKASGALVVPQNPGKPLPLVTYQHGTITQTNAAPSSMNLNGEVSVGSAFASTGYAALVPDYLGLGDSPGLHPYHHARSEATACVDLLRAAKTFCSTNGIVLTNKLFLCGYSQGGHATMALLKELETYHTNEFQVTACAPMAGAYDLSGVTTTNFLSRISQPNPYYFLYLLAAYQDVYHFAPSLADVLASPYDVTLPPLLNGNVSGSQINAAMPTNGIPSDILKPEFLAAFSSNPRHPLRLALEENDLDHWVPRSLMRLYHCAADRDVIIANSQIALANFHALGANQVELIDPMPTADHGGCSYPSLLGAKAWFDSLR